MDGGWIVSAVAFLPLYAKALSENILTSVWKRTSLAPLTLMLIIIGVAVLHECSRVFGENNLIGRFLKYTGERSLELYLLHIIILNVYMHYVGFSHFDRFAITDYGIVIAVSYAIAAIIHPVIGRISGKILGTKS